MNNEVKADGSIQMTEPKEIMVTIPLSKYEELLMIKGKYEELSKIYAATVPMKWNGIRFNGKEWNTDKIPEPTVTLLREDIHRGLRSEVD